MDFIKDFNAVFDSFVCSVSKMERQTRNKFANTSYLWVLIGWFISIVLVLVGYYTQKQMGEMSIFVVVGVFSCFLQKMTLKFSPSKTYLPIILIGSPIIAFYLKELELGLLIITLYFPSLMLAKNFQLVIQRKFLKLSEKSIANNLLVSVISYYLPVHLLLHSRMTLTTALVLLSFIVFIICLSLKTLVKTMMNKKDRSIWEFSIVGIFIVLIMTSLFSYLTVLFLI